MAGRVHRDGDDFLQHVLSRRSRVAKRPTCPAAPAGQVTSTPVHLDRVQCPPDLDRSSRGHRNYVRREVADRHIGEMRVPFRIVAQTRIPIDRPSPASICARGMTHSTLVPLVPLQFVTLVKRHNSRSADCHCGSDATVPSKHRASPPFPCEMPSGNHTVSLGSGGI
jgi:hypothetical protein